MLEHVGDAPAGAALAVFDRLGIDLGVLSVWRREGTYPDDIDVVWADAVRRAAPYAVMAAEIAGVVATHLQQEMGGGAILDAAVAQRDRLATRIAGQDVHRGVPATPGIDI